MFTSGNTFKTDQFLAVSGKKTVEFLIKQTNLWLENVFQSAVVAGISLLTDLSAAHSFVPNRGDCKWSGGTTDG